MTTIATVLCDLDGTILDTTELILASFRHAFASRGEVVPDTLLLEHFGRPLAESFRRLRPGWSDDEVRQMVGRYLDHNHQEHDGGVSLVPGADGALHTLRSLGYRLAIVTSKREAMADHGLTLFGLRALFEVLVHADSTALSKPDPAPVQYALRQMDVPPQRAVMVGDSPYDMMAAQRAGCHTVGLVHNTFSASDLLGAGAERVVSRWDEIPSAIAAVADMGDAATRTAGLGP